jgi:hemophore-related protein
MPTPLTLNPGKAMLEARFSLEPQHEDYHMRKLASSSIVPAVGAVILSLAAGAGTANAEPALDAAINTTCTYPQVVAALNAQAPEVAQQFAATPQAQGWLKAFLATPPSQRPAMAQQLQSIPAAAEFLSLVPQVVSTCSNY